jgi:hypothetical protein
MTPTKEVGDLLVYAVVVLFVAVHGPVPMSWLRPRTRAS